MKARLRAYTLPSYTQQYVKPLYLPVPLNIRPAKAKPVYIPVEHDEFFQQGLFWKGRTKPREDIVDVLHRLYPVIVQLLILTLICSVFSIFYHKELIRKEVLRTEQQIKSTFNYSGLLARCLNGETLFDKNSNTALFTEKATAVKIETY